MSFLPTLDPIATQVLGILLERGNIAGYELMKMADGKQPKELMEAITTLRKNDLVQVAGNPERDFEFARFAVLPSAKSFASMISRQTK